LQYVLIIEQNNNHLC